MTELVPVVDTEQPKARMWQRLLSLLSIAAIVLLLGLLAVPVFLARAMSARVVASPTPAGGVVLSNRMLEYDLEFEELTVIANGRVALAAKHRSGAGLLLEPGVDLAASLRKNGWVVAVPSDGAFIPRLGQLLDLRVMNQNGRGGVSEWRCRLAMGELPQC